MKKTIFVISCVVSMMCSGIFCSAAVESADASSVIDETLGIENNQEYAEEVIVSDFMESELISLEKSEDSSAGQIENEAESDQAVENQDREEVETIDIENCEYSCPSYTYTGNAIVPKVQLFYEGVKLKEETDFVIDKYENNKKAGTAKVYITGTGKYSGSRIGNFAIKKKNVSGLKFSSVKARKYTGSSIKPNVTVKHGSNTLKHVRDYKISYKNNIKIGTASILIKGTGNYSGSKTIKFAIKPRESVITSVQKNGKGCLKINWKKIPEAQGYVIYRATSAYGNYSKIKNITSSSTISYNNSGLKNNKKYYYKVRAYKKVGSKYYFSGYSSAKSATTMNVPDTFPGTYIYRYDNGYSVRITITKDDGYYVAKAYGRGGRMNTSRILYKSGSNYNAYYEWDGDIFFTISNRSSRGMYVRFPYISEFNGWYTKQ